MEESAFSNAYEAFVGLGLPPFLTGYHMNR